MTMARARKSSLPAVPPHHSAGVRAADLRPSAVPPSRRDRLNRPASFLSQSSLAAELDVKESDIPKLVERGVIPRPSIWPGGIMRWEWDLVVQALSQRNGANAMEDPFIVGARNATAAR